MVPDFAYWGKAEQSVRHLQTAVALGSNDGSTLYNAACTYGVLEKRVKAGYCVSCGPRFLRHDEACIRTTPHLNNQVCGLKFVLVPALRVNPIGQVAAAEACEERRTSRRTA
jgi:hypothetical protein